MQRNTLHLLNFFRFKPAEFKPPKALFIVILLMISSVSLIFSSTTYAKKQNEDTIKVNVLENNEYNECMFVDEVVIGVKYRLKTVDYGSLITEITTDGVSYYEVSAIDIERGKGEIIMTFDAGDCAIDMRVVFR
ncbi:hypothetical protein [uncultured Paraglaciecola sp.]|uniref:hypothetical protein n=1 Tax=uncultured Paraglaciecola sp. TaxID=1765024 RepID=UPI0030DC1949|tara:strand:+ start:957 stop:1358 length:402 start_codon:yes stop_codon:yes gene_type:complete